MIELLLSPIASWLIRNNNHIMIDTNHKQQDVIKSNTRGRCARDVEDLPIPSIPNMKLKLCGSVSEDEEWRCARGQHGLRNKWTSVSQTCLTILNLNSLPSGAAHPISRHSLFFIAPPPHPSLPLSVSLCTTPSFITLYLLPNLSSSLISHLSLLSVVLYSSLYPTFFFSLPLRLYVPSFPLASSDLLFYLYPVSSLPPTFSSTSTLYHRILPAVLLTLNTRTISSRYYTNPI